MTEFEHTTKFDLENVNPAFAKPVLPAVASEKLHRKLVEAAYRWVLKNSSCGVAFKELNTNACNGEYPDVIGFGAWGHSVLIECKTSRRLGFDLCE